eukprot:TRINITY_DN55721_c0_g1_i1.p1 TRINITY_DN55721_c0_g1~~TRINITY_DN55721_c0_g1_i1.p1  ORF type:complete len:1131 (+),score=193.61 TRINITY_DN55721_c0_g1_i1:235-3393(+)
MQADSSVKFTVPEALKPAGNSKDSRVTLPDLRKCLAELTPSDLEDVKWFAESVVRVEHELREVWRAAVQMWRGRVECLYKRNLHRYLLTSQPERVSRWLLLRTSMEEVSKDDSSIGLLGLGISQQEVEVLFTDETADDINRCSDKIELFLVALDTRDQLSECCSEMDASHNCTPEQDSRTVDLLQKLAELSEHARELACLLIHEDTLSYVTAVIRSGVISQSAICEGSKVLMALMAYRVHENARDYEKMCRQRAADYLEIDCDMSGFSLELDRNQRCGPGKPLGVMVGKAPRQTIADWVGSLLTLRVDFDRGEMLDVLIKYDERRLLLEGDGGDRKDETTPVAVSLFSHGRTVPYLLGRLDVSSHHTLHEHRTPMRTHLWKFLLNVLSSAGDRGRNLFRAGEGMRVICNVLRGSAWGVEREEVSLEEEQDRQEEEELYRTSQSTWGLRDPYHSWPHVEYFEFPQREHRYYSMDFLDDKFYGSKDRMLAAAFLEYMSSEGMWGEVALVEEMMQHPNTLQVLCRVRPPCCFLMRLLLSSSGFPVYLRNTAARLAEDFMNGVLRMLCDPDATCHSMFPVCYDLEDAASEATLATFRERITEVERKNVLLRILAHAYHSLQTCLKEERSIREGDGPRSDMWSSSVNEEPLDPATQLEEEITECCKLIAQQVPLVMEEIAPLSVAIYIQVKDFTRKALLAVNQLPPVNADERQKARGLEVAKTVPPRPMYFGHYQQLIYNQSNPTQPSARSMIFESQARLKCLQGTADILFTGENRYLSEPSLFPYEFLVVLRIVQLLRLREPSVPPFIVELQDVLEQLTGQRSSFIFSDTREDIELAGAEYPWRTGLAQLNTFRVSQVPLRRSNLQRLPRNTPLEVAQGLGSILREYVALNVWEEETDDSARTSRTKNAQRLEALAVRRSVLLALVFNHLCYFHPKMVTLEDSPQGLALRLGISDDVLADVEGVLSRAELEGHRSGADFVAAQLPDECRVFRCSPDASIVVLQVHVKDTKVAFVCMKGIWSLWANCTKDNAQVLTECSHVQKYFAFGTVAAGSHSD